MNNYKPKVTIGRLELERGAAEREIASLKVENERLKAQGPGEGHRKPCYYCGKPCNALAGDPGQWPIPLCHADEPGRVKWHHTGCVSKRLVERDWLEAKCAEIQALVNAQAEDDGLWFLATTAAEAYLQQELRKLHVQIESDNPGPLIARLEKAEADLEAERQKGDVCSLEWNAEVRRLEVRLEEALAAGKEDK